MEFAKANLTPKAVSLRYFTKEREDHWKCKCGKVIQQKKRTKATRTYSTISKEPTPKIVNNRRSTECPKVEKTNCRAARRIQFPRF